MSTVNPWKRFIGLLPGGVRTVGTVTSINSNNGTSNVQLRNGTSVAVQGVSVAVGLMAFVVDGRVAGPAPALDQYEVEV
ncbi:hypothetical protein HG264_04365 [Pseudomonas sp. gcc21]|uniref:hypothetical protein n=1 Tax=Pseudomonas sp. gcc21 TaxID=2726989 RepID=UPI0014512AD1|nr:hypothetical protein [Pseudomonas sp. gcc21]QJD58201.1 hypothetical protein HG264_04365 [Pseudomonas sp. gcc21]